MKIFNAPLEFFTQSVALAATRSDFFVTPECFVGQVFSPHRSGQ